MIEKIGTAPIFFQTHKTNLRTLVLRVLLFNVVFLIPFFLHISFFSHHSSLSFRQSNTQVFRLKTEVPHYAIPLFDHNTLYLLKTRTFGNFGNAASKNGERPSHVDHFSCHPAIHDKIGPFNSSAPGNSISERTRSRFPDPSRS